MTHGPHVKPEVSVIVAAYNSEKYISETIDSLLSQTLTNFEIIIVDDGSTDGTVALIEKYQDPRIKLFKNSTNMGVVYSRNRAIGESSAEYIAVCDSDDISLPQRLEIQVSFLDSHPGIGLIGSFVELIDASGSPIGTIWKNKLPGKLIPGILLFQNYFTTSSTMFRREVLPSPEPFRPRDPAEDYDLWTRIAVNWQMATVPRILVHYRVHENNLHTLKVDRKNQMVGMILIDSLARLGLEPSETELVLHRTNYGYAGKDPLAFLEAREKWLKKVLRHNTTHHYYDQKLFPQVIAERWLASISSNADQGFAVWRLFWKSSLSHQLPKFLWYALARFGIKCLLRRR